MLSRYQVCQPCMCRKRKIDLKQWLDVTACHLLMAYSRGQPWRES